LQEVVKRIKDEGFLPKSENFAISKEKFKGFISEDCFVKGAAEYHKNSGCKVKACKDLYLLLNDACVLESSVTTESLDDLLGLAKQLLDLGLIVLAGIAAGVVVIIILLVVCCYCVCCKKVKEKKIDEHDEEDPEGVKEDAEEVAEGDPDEDAAEDGKEAPVEEVAGDDPDEDADEDADEDGKEAPVEEAPEEEESSDDDAAAFVTETLEESTPLPKTSNASKMSSASHVSS